MLKLTLNLLSYIFGAAKFQLRSNFSSYYRPSSLWVINYDQLFSEFNLSCEFIIWDFAIIHAISKLGKMSIPGISGFLELSSRNFLECSVPMLIPGITKLFDNKSRSAIPLIFCFTKISTINGISWILNNWAD